LPEVVMGDLDGGNRGERSVPEPDLDPQDRGAEPLVEVGKYRRDVDPERSEHLLHADHGKRVEAAQRGRQAWVGAGPYGFAEESDNGLDLQVSAAPPPPRGPHRAPLPARRGAPPA